MTKTARNRPIVLMPFVQSALPPFAQADLDSLSETFDVRVVPCRSAVDMVQAMFAVRTASAMFCWFGSIRYLPVVVTARLLRRPILVVAGGYDVAAVPEIAYGNMIGGPVRWAGRLLFRLATIVSPYSRAGAAEATVNAGVPPARQRMIYLGLDADQFGEGVPIEEKESIVLTVGVMNRSSVQRKGIETIVRASRLLPDVAFIIAGGGDESTMQHLKALAGPNVEFTGFVDEARLKELYRKSRIYCQPSIHEAFGYALAEAMLFNCIPVTSGRGSLPEIAGQAGYYVQPGDPAELATAIEAGLARSSYGPATPRERITDTFPRTRRSAELVATMKELIRDPDSPRPG